MNCPICKAPTVTAYRPFCSKRCADLDLGNWLRGTYSVPAQDPEDFENAEEETASTPRRPH